MNSNIFNNGQASFLKALPGFSAVAELALPVTPARAGSAVFYTLKPVTESGKSFLPVFSGPALPETPFIKRPLRDAAVMLFNSPGQYSFIFNPRNARPEAPLTASKRDMSLLAGFADSGGRAAQDSGRLAAGEFSLGKLHSAHYLYTLAAGLNRSSGLRFSLASVLIELGLLQEAYDGLKTDRNPEALLSLAIIYRKTGNHAAARKFLAEIGPGTPLEDRKAAEAAWLDLETGKEEEAYKEFKRLSASAYDKAEALSGLGEVLSRAAFRTKDRGRIAEAQAALNSALVTPSPESGRIFMQLGSLYFRSGDPARAVEAYRKAEASMPSIEVLANLVMALLKTGRQAEAAAVTLRIALTDMTVTARLTGNFPQEKLSELFPPPRPEAAASQPAPKNIQPPPLQAAAPLTPAAVTQPRAPTGAEASLSPARPQSPAPSISPGRRGMSTPPGTGWGQLETLSDAMSAAQPPSEDESRKDNFISRAFRLASTMEDELGRKVYYNLDGLEEVEKRLRLAFIKSKENPQANLDIVRDCAAFLCYFLQERHKGRLIKLEEYDPWGWPMSFDAAGARTVSYPVERVWRLLWSPVLPEPGWLLKYSSWLSGILKAPPASSSGTSAVRAKTMSHPERISDVQTEHRRMLILISSLPETSHIELGRTGLLKLENALKNNFKPGIPPATDGWKLLRCYGHIMAEILIKDFKASWYNADGNDGSWSLRLPWKTFVFPLGKVYRTAADRGSLTDYYDILLADKLRNSGPSAG